MSIYILALLIGVVAGLLLCGMLARLLDHVGAASAWTIVTSFAVLLVAAAGAAFVPAVRVLRVDPAEALRGQ